MAGALRKTMVYLGLAEDELYDEDYQDYPDDDETGRDPYRGDQRGQAHRSEARDRGQVTHLPTRALSRVEAGPGSPDLARITTIHTRTYNEAKTIGESFRDGTPVIMNLSDMSDSDAKRLVDFAAGLVFGLHGAIERVTSKVFLLSPAHVEVATEEAEDSPTGRGFFNQS